MDDGKYGTLNEIFKLNNIPNTKENRKQFRNALAHAEFVFIDNEKNFLDGKLHLDNEKIKCDIPYNLLILINDTLIKNMFTLFYDKNDLCITNLKFNKYCVPNGHTLNTKNGIKKLFEKSEIIFFDKQKSSDIEDNIDQTIEKLKFQFNELNVFGELKLKRRLVNSKKYQGFNKFEIRKHKADSKFVDFMCGYVNYIGVNGFNELYKNSYYMEVMNDIINMYICYDEGNYRFISSDLLENAIYANSKLDIGKFKDFLRKAKKNFEYARTDDEKLEAMDYLDILREMTYEAPNTVNKLNYFESPFLYSGFLLDYVSYECCYLKGIYDEYQEKNGKELFKYKDIRIKGQSYLANYDLIKTKYINQDEIDKLNPDIEFHQKYIKEIFYQLENKMVLNSTNCRKPDKYEILDKLDEKIKTYGLDNYQEMISILADKVLGEELTENYSKREVLGILNKLLNSRNSFEYSKRSTNLTDKEIEIKEKFETVMKKYKDKNNQDYNIEKDIPKLNELLNKKDKLIQEGTYRDSKQFFRCLRNSIAHGRYKIDYTKAFQTKRLDNTKFKFWDEDENGKKNFEYEVNGKYLQEMLNSLRETVINQLGQDYFKPIPVASEIQNIELQEEQSLEDI